jgi:hypothetical protein
MLEPFTYPIKKFDANGNQTYYENSDGRWYKREFDDNRNQTYFEDSYSQWIKAEYDADGNITKYEDSDGTIMNY